MSLKQQALTGVKWTSIASGVAVILGLIKIAVLARLLDPSDFGLMAIVAFVMGFSSLFMNMGLASAILHKPEISKEEYASLFWLSVLFSFILVLIIALISPLVSHMYGEPELSLLIPLMSVNIVLSAMGYQFKTIAQKDLRFQYIAYTEMGGVFSGVLVSIFLALRGFGVYALIFGGIFHVLFVNTIYFLCGIYGSGLAFRFSMELVRPFLNIGMYQVGGQMINYFNKDLDILIIGKLFGTEVLGGYSLAKQLAVKPGQIINPIFSFVASPLLAGVQHNKKKLKEGYLKLVNTVGAINFPIHLTLIIFAPIVVDIIYGEEYKHIVFYVQILLIYMFLRSLGNPFGSLTTATGKTYYDFYWNLIVALFFPLAIFSGAQFGVAGIPLFLTAAMVILMYPFWYFGIKPQIFASFTEYLKASFVYRYKALYNEWLPVIAGS